MLVHFIYVISLRYRNLDAVINFIVYFWCFHSMFLLKLSKDLFQGAALCSAPNLIMYYLFCLSWASNLCYLRLLTVLNFQFWLHNSAISFLFYVFKITCHSRLCLFLILQQFAVLKLALHNHFFTVSQFTPLCSWLYRNVGLSTHFALQLLAVEHILFQIKDFVFFFVYSVELKLGRFG